MSRVINEQQIARAALLATLRDFFKQRQVLEVQTPLLRDTVGLESSIDPIYIPGQGFLQTSPELAMKQLLAQGAGSIYQICPAFRDHEHGALHRREFTLLEWYRVGFDHHALMLEMGAFLECTLNTPAPEKISYRDIFLEKLDFDPHGLTLSEGLGWLEKYNIQLSKAAQNNLDVCDILEILFSQKIEKQLGHKAPVFIYDYPIEQAALAKIRANDPPVAERFEVYVKGVELANGFHELNCAKEQRARFNQDNQKRVQYGKPKLPIDEDFLSGLDKLPDCSGVALGVDRLLMLKMNRQAI